MDRTEDLPARAGIRPVPVPSGGGLWGLASLPESLQALGPDVLREATSFILDPYAAVGLRFVVVVDSDAMLSSIDNQCRSGQPSRIYRMGQSRICRLYAADHVYWEIYSRFDKIALSSSATTADLRTCFERDYLPFLHWVSVSDQDVSDARVCAVTDTSDIPTAQLASLIAPCLVLLMGPLVPGLGSLSRALNCASPLTQGVRKPAVGLVSEDRALRRPGFAPNEWRPAAGSAVLIVDSTSRQEGTALGVGGPPVALVAASIKLAEKVGIPWWIAVLAIGAGAWWLLSDPERRQKVGSAAGVAMEAVAGLLGEAAEWERAGISHLREVMVSPISPPTVKQQVMTVLARSRGPLLAAETSDEIARCFLDCPVSVAEVRSCLRGGSEFSRRQYQRWELGRLGGPWSG